MSDENAKKAISDVSHALEMWFGSQLAEWPDNPTKYFGTPAREAVMAGRASRDAEVERLQAEVKSLRANWENECGNLEMADRKVESLRQQLAGSEHDRLLGEKKLAKTQAEQQDMEEGFRSFLGSYNLALNGLAERDAVIERVRAYADQVDPAHLDEQPIWPTSVRNILDAATPSTLDALIRQKQADALEEAADYVDWYVARPVGMNNTDQQYFRPWRSKWLRNLAADYRNEVDHE